jgi:hypothetical protein
MASMIAPSLFMSISLVFVFFIETLPWIIHLSRSNPVEQAIFGYKSLVESVGGELIDLTQDVIFGPLISVPFGFLGAALFLLPFLSSPSLVRAKVGSLSEALLPAWLTQSAESPSPVTHRRGWC